MQLLCSLLYCEERESATKVQYYSQCFRIFIQSILRETLKLIVSNVSFQVYKKKERKLWTTLLATAGEMNGLMS